MLLVYLDNADDSELGKDEVIDLRTGHLLNSTLKAVSHRILSYTPTACIRCPWKALAIGSSVPLTSANLSPSMFDARVSNAANNVA